MVFGGAVDVRRLPRVARRCKRWGRTDPLLFNAPTLHSPGAQVTVTHQGKTHTLEVPADRSIHEVALDQGVDLPHDCKLGVCMTCPAKLVSGSIDQSGAMLSDDVEEKGFALLCVACPRSDVEVVTCTEDELLEVQLCA